MNNSLRELGAELVLTGTLLAAGGLVLQDQIPALADDPTCDQTSIVREMRQFNVRETICATPEGNVAHYDLMPEPIKLLGGVALVVSAVSRGRRAFNAWSPEGVDDDKDSVKELV